MLQLFHTRHPMRRRRISSCVLVVWAAWCLLGCTSQDGLIRKGPTKQITLSLQQVKCGKCAASMAHALQRHKGVQRATYDKPKAEVSVWYHPSQVTPDEIQSVIKQVGYNCKMGAGKGSYPAEVKFSPGADVKWISKKGEDVDIKDHIQKGKVTVFDFYNIWCHPCRLIDKKMKVWLQQRKDLAYRKLNIGDWKTPVARRYMAGVPTLPYLLIYDRHGKLFKKLMGYRPYTLKETIEKAARQ